MTIKDCVHGADGRQLDIAAAPAQLLANFRSTPAGVLLLKLHDGRLDMEWQAIGVPIGPAGAVSEPLQGKVLEAFKDLIAGLARDIELSTHRGHVFALDVARQSG